LTGALADIHIMILRRRDGVSIATVAGQCREAQCLVAVLLMDAEKAQWRGGEQPVDAGLNVGAHMTREHPRGRYQFVRRGAGEMHGERMEGKLEFFVAGNVGKFSPDLAHAVIADDRRFSLQRKVILAEHFAAECASAIQKVLVPCDFSAGDT